MNENIADLRAGLRSAIKWFEGSAHELRHQQFLATRAGERISLCVQARAMEAMASQLRYALDPEVEGERIREEATRRIEEIISQTAR